jgi:hypothetical protein
MVGARSRASVAAGILFGLAAAEVAMAIVFGFLSPLSWAELVAFSGWRSRWPAGRSRYIDRET